MRISARAIIIENGKVLTMFRRKVKDGEIKEYYVIPGGGQEEDEELIDTVKRELKEELSVDIEVLGYLGDSGDGSNYFHCQIINGTPKLGGEELDRMSDENYYEPRFIQLDGLENIDLFGKEFVKKAIDKFYL